MDVVTPDQIKAMSDEDRARLNRQLHGKFAAQIVGLLFVKLAIPGVARVLVTKAIIVAAKRAA